MDEYLIQYLRPVFSMFADGSFGCCESLNGKLGLVKTLPNLRRITISECTDWDYAIDELGADYLMAVRPVLVDTVYTHDDDAIRKGIRTMADRFKGTRWELNFPGALSFNGDQDRFHRFVQIAREELE